MPPSFLQVVIKQSAQRTDTDSLRKKAQAKKRQEWWLAAVLLAPNLLLLAIFTYRPLLDNIRLSFFNWNISSPTSTFVGFQNYAEWVSRDDTKVIVSNTVIFTFFAVIGSLILGLALALLLNQKLRGRNFTRSVVFAPYAISGAAIGIAFQFIFDPNFGLIQEMLGWFGVDSPNFYAVPGWALFMVTFTFVWKNLGYTFVIYLAALQGLSKDLEEAAAIDGASTWTRFRRVTLPQLRPTTFFLSITVTLNSVQVFDIINVMTRGGPQGNGTTTLVFQIYQETFVNFRAGYGATAATIMFLILLIITLIQVRIMDKRDH
ncbi:carbohydrate ABC transporter permease [Corynebacterium striatum]|uniref:Sugar ABC transporter permease n=1 Tax=Corynebacterium striatum TaxID=43770 RepID=A0ABC8CM82_CORST|nr:sugar ABC transporter permease [Corynebacterium striatum]ATZ05936.1 sugar ABC transporter permease [Corynebacterium striatum]ATZ09669.1 sugar ABC transporter permease [Corynebacterium striatum]EGT5575382.1 sugar ABC transporter permease [Corynebacterium striatum]EGT5612427.1 sugar ABC transporter permease [Corynebacterium striatum]EGT5787382.1 sugar ABC transporter permease [Corynebacterium striatum]